MSNAAQVYSTPLHGFCCWGSSREVDLVLAHRTLLDNEARLRSEIARDYLFHVHWLVIRRTNRGRGFKK
jgi:hypothetical protein